MGSRKQRRAGQIPEEIAGAHQAPGCSQPKPTQGALLTKRTRCCAPDHLLHTYCPDLKGSSVMAQEEVEWLKEQLQGVEQEIKEQLARIEAAMKAKESPELISLIREERDRLVEEKKDMRHQLSALQAKLASPSVSSVDLLVSDNNAMGKLRYELLRPYKRTKTGVGEGTPSKSWINTEDCEAAALWRNDIEGREVPCEVATVDSLLGHESTGLRADLRYLRMLLDDPTTLASEISTLISARKARVIGQKDLELPYHPLVVYLFQAASAGQVGLRFERENQTADDASREDVRGMILVDGSWMRLEPSEIKAFDFPSKPGDPVSGIHANADGFGKILKCAKLRSLGAREPPVTTLGVLVSRCQYVWFLELQWQRIGWPEWEVQSCRVAPGIPEYRVLAEGQLMARLKWEEVEDELEKEAGQIGFSELMQWANLGRSDPPPGFRYLSRYSDRLAALHNLQLSPVQLRSTDGTTCPLTDATVIAHGHRSLMLQTHPDADFVVKVGSYDHIRMEHRAHAHIDKEDCLYLRKAVPGMHGLVDGAGSGLSFIGLQHFCPRNITAADLATPDGKQKYSSQACQALQAIHASGTLHRDIKPDNMLLSEDGNLLLNDFDAACLERDPTATRNTDAGTPAFRSPRLDGAGPRSFQALDDWASGEADVEILFW
ncbi:g8665 [Coccomyxa elongata]